MSTSEQCVFCREDLDCTFTTLDLKEYLCHKCGQLYTIMLASNAVTIWPDGTPPTYSVDEMIDDDVD